MADELNFNLDLQSKPIKIQGKDYIITEATGDIAARWRNSMISQATLDKRGRPKSIGNVADGEPLLVHLCLKKKGDQTPIPLEEIKGWPSRVIKPIYNIIVEMSDLDETKEEEDDDTKKSQNSTGDGSA